MNSLNNSDMYKIKGGAISVTMVNAISRVVSTLFSLGQAVGSAIRRGQTKNYC